MNNILVIADFDEQQTTAIERAIELAKLYKASLNIVYFCYESMRHISGDKEAVKAKFIATQKLNAETQIEQLDFDGVEKNIEVVWEKHIAQWVEQYVESNNPEMVVKTGHRTETLFYTPTDWQLLRDCSAPLMIAAEKKWRKTPNVLAAVDLESANASKQELNHKVLTQAAALAQHQAAELFVCYTIPFSPLLRDLGVQYVDELENAAEQKLKPVVEALAAQYKVPVENFIQHVGQPERVIPSTAAKVKAGLVVMGTVGRKGITGKIIGNTAEKVLKLLKSDVIALKPDN